MSTASLSSLAAEGSDKISIKTRMRMRLTELLVRVCGCLVYGVLDRRIVGLNRDLVLSRA